MQPHIIIPSIPTSLALIPPALHLYPAVSCYPFPRVVPIAPRRTADLAEDASLPIPCFECCCCWRCCHRYFCTSSSNFILLYPSITVSINVNVLYKCSTSCSLSPVLRLCLRLTGCHTPPANQPTRRTNAIQLPPQYPPSAYRKRNLP